MELELKVTKKGALSYHPSGVPILKFAGSFSQKIGQKNGMGVVEVIALEELAEDFRDQVRIGKSLKIYGQLFEVKKEISIVAQRIETI